MPYVPKIEMIEGVVKEFGRDQVQERQAEAERKSRSFQAK